MREALAAGLLDKFKLKTKISTGGRCLDRRQRGAVGSRALRKAATLRRKRQPCIALPASRPPCLHPTPCPQAT